MSSSLKEKYQRLERLADGFLLSCLADLLAPAPEDVLPVDLVLLPHRAMKLVPVLHVEPEVDMEVLVVVVVEDAVRLPRLPPLFLNIKR